MLESESKQKLICCNCGSVIIAPLESEAGDFFLRCLGCGVKNLLGFTVAIIGCRREDSLAEELRSQIEIQPSIH
jgi:hypothetical protein